MGCSKYKQTIKTTRILSRINNYLRISNPPEDSSIDEKTFDDSISNYDGRSGPPTTRILERAGDETDKQDRKSERQAERELAHQGGVQVAAQVPVALHEDEQASNQRGPAGFDPREADPSSQRPGGEREQERSRE